MSGHKRVTSRGQYHNRGPNDIIIINPRAFERLKIDDCYDRCPVPFVLKVLKIVTIRVVVVVMCHIRVYVASPYKQMMWPFGPC